MIAPYRVSFIEKIIEGSKDRYDWMFYYGTKNKEDGRPAYDGEIKFQGTTYSMSEKKIGPWTIVDSPDLLDNLKAYNPDIISMYGNVGALANWRVLRWARKNKKKIVLWVCSWDSGKSHHIFKTLKRNISKIYYKKSDYFVCYSTHAANFLMDLGISRNIIKVVYNGLDIENLDRASIIKDGGELRNKNGLDNNAKLFLYVGGLISEKKPVELIRAFKSLEKKYNNIHLWVIGDGPLKNDVLKECTSSHIKYWGRITDGVDKYFAACDWFVLPGCGGLALNQAMFVGKPCICDKADGTEWDLVFDGISGLKFNSDLKDNLEHSMENAILLDDKNYQTMSNISHVLIKERSNVNKMVETYLNVIDTVTKYIK